MDCITGTALGMAMSKFDLVDTRETLIHTHLKMSVMTHWSPRLMSAVPEESKGV